jgi:DNA processing protein
MAVPGHPFDGRASGCNNLLRDGAGLIRGARDIIETLANASPLASHNVPQEEELDNVLFEAPPSVQRDLSDHAALHSLILGRLGPVPISEDLLIRDIGARAEHVSSELVSLELDGKVKRRSGGLLALA